VNRISSQYLDELLTSHGSALVLFARQWCADPDDALQEALIDLASQRVTPLDPVAWLFTATKRKALNQARGASRRQQRHTASAQPSKTSLWFDNHLEKQEEAIRLQECLEKLDPLERQILVSRIWGNLSFSQIADVVESSSSTVHRIHHAALQKMRTWLEAPRVPNEAELSTKIESHKIESQT
jgi:RNA polymerase sigma factor (sigma-70 family)